METQTQLENEYLLIIAARNGNLNEVKYLIEQGADVHAFRDEALRWAARNGHLEVVKFLFEQGADIHAENDGAIRWAAESGHLEIVEYLNQYTNK